MQECIKGRLEQLSRFLKREKPIKTEVPYYINDDYDLLYHIDPYLHNLMDRTSFQNLQTSLQDPSIDDVEVVDIGASRNFLRGLVFLDVTKTVAIDPAYKWYDYESVDLFAPTPYPRGIFGGKAERKEMEKLLQYSCSNLSVPGEINKDSVNLITGQRKGRQRLFELVPQDANKWLLDQEPQTISNFVVYRVFPSPSVWGRIISSLKEGGILITTGYGKYDTPWSAEERYEPDIAQGGGVGVDGTPVPANGNADAIGSTLVAQLGQVYFYRKIHHLEPDSVIHGILDNQ